MIDFQNISKHFGTRTLLDNVSFRINSGDKVGVVGCNGAGKSTLFSLITGELTPDGGTIALPKNLRIGFLHQQLSDENNHRNVVDFTADAIPELRTIQQELKLIEHELAEASDMETALREQLLKRHGDLQSTFEHLGGYTLHADAEAALSGLGFTEEMQARTMAEFSGGWRMRAALASVLIAMPDILLLDEPSNYLDIPAVEWLCRFLKGFPGTLLLISHDRFLLSKLTDITLEVNKGHVTRYPGNYDFYRRERAARQHALESQFANQERRKEQMQRTIDRFRAKSTKAAQAKSLQKALDRIEDIELLDDFDVTGALRLPEPPKAGAEAARFDAVSFGYPGERDLFQDVTLAINSGDKIAFIGYNGTGKTTLLKLLDGKLQPRSGSVVLGHHIVPGYQAQEFSDLMNLECSVYDVVKAATPAGFSLNTLPNILASFGFPGDESAKSCKVLSGGEKIRLCFARIFVNPPNLLILDEPTTHLDIAGRETLQDVLKQYPGTVCLVSHDIEFVRNVATTIVAMRTGGVKKYFGNYDYYLDKLAEENAGTSSNTSSRSNEKNKSVANNNSSDFNSKAKRQERAKLRQALSAEKQKAERLVADLEQKIERFEARQVELLEEMHKPPGPNFGVLAKELAELQSKMTRTTEQWEKAMADLEKILAANAEIQAI